MKTDTLDPAFFKPPESTEIVYILKAAEFHWHFSQGLQAIDKNLYVPGVLSLLAGIEASLRFTLYQLNSTEFPFEDDLGAVLSNSLLRQAKEAGLPVSTLAFPREDDFIANLAARKPEVRIVKIRNDLAHGNIQSFVNRELGDELAFFTPECLRPLAHELKELSLCWAKDLAAFRAVMKA
ncbi:hypothetical protein [Delftia lacustris]